MSETRTWAIRSARLFDGTGATAIEDAVVLIEGERVSAVGPASDVAIPHGAEVLDAGDATLLPGLIDAHVHMLHTGSASSGVDSRAMNDRQLLLVGARNSLAALKSGLTTVRDCGDHDYMTLTMRDSIAEGVLPGPRMLCSGPVITSTAGQLWWTGIECDTPDELRRAVRTLAKNGVDFIKLMGSGGNATPGSNPEVSQYDEEGYRAVADDAHRLGKRVAVHVHGVDAIRMAVEAGMDTLEHCPFRANGGIEYDAELAEDIRRKGIIVSIAMPATWYRLRAEDMRDVRAHPGHLWESRPESIRAMYEAGVKLVVSSDQGSTGTAIDELHLLMAYLVDRVGMSPEAVIHGATGLAAEALGLEGELGTVEPGKLADLALVEGDPFADMSAMANVRTVVKGGRVVVRDGAVVV